MALLVHKYGGTSVGTLDRIGSIASFLASVYRADNQLVVVVSAMGQQTDELLEMALQLNENPPQRELDMLLSAGERVSMSLLAIALSKLEVPTVSFTGSQSGILTNNNFGNAQIKKILGDRIRHALNQKKLVIVAGFQGMSEHEKEITTLGRGGSDLTAIALAQALKADRCQIFKDVDGVCTADPRIVPEARLLNHLSWDSLNHLTWYGSGVVHNRGVHLAKKFQIPLEIKSSFNLDTSGTSIGGHRHMETAVVYAVTQKNNLCLLTIRDLPAKFSHHIFKFLADSGDHPLYFVNHSTEGHQYTDLLVATRALPSLLKVAHELQSGITHEIKHKNLTCITVVGDGFWQDSSVLESVNQSIASELILLDCKNSFINIVIPEEESAATIAQLHKHLIEASST